MTRVTGHGITQADIKRLGIAEAIVKELELRNFLTQCIIDTTNHAHQWATRSANQYGNSIYRSWYDAYYHHLSIYKATYGWAGKIPYHECHGIHYKDYVPPDNEVRKRRKRLHYD